MQKMQRVAASITWKKTDRKDSSEKVWRKVTTIFEKITTVMKISKARLIRLLLSPICMILKILAFRGKEFSLFIKCDPLHTDPSKGICHRADQDNDGKDRAEIFDHDHKYLFPSEPAFAVKNLFFDLIDTNDS